MCIRSAAIRGIGPLGLSCQGATRRGVGRHEGPAGTRWAHDGERGGWVALGSAGMGPPPLPLSAGGVVALHRTHYATRLT